MARRRLTVRRIDPWSVLKFGAVVNVALLIIGLLVVGVIFYIVDRIGLVDQVCTIVLDLGFTACGINAANLFRAIALLGLLGVIIQTAVLVFLSFLHNLIADLTGGLTLSVIDDTPVPGARSATTGTAAVTTARRPPARPARDEPVRDGGRDERNGGRDAGRGDRGEVARPPVPPIGSDGADRSDGDTAAMRPTPRETDAAGARSRGRERSRPRDRGSGDDLFRPI